MTTPLSVVVPLYNSRDTISELITRIAASCPPRTEAVFVDDACPLHSGEWTRSLEPHIGGRVVSLDRNVGQHAAVLIGLAHARGRLVAVMDADLQDAPEDLPILIEALTATRGEPTGLVAAGRRGEYESTSRQRTARAYRRTVAVLSRGRVPPDAGMFCVMTDDAKRRVLDLDDPLAPLIPAAAHAGVRIRCVPIERFARKRGDSSTSPTTRLRVALRGCVTVTPLEGLARRTRAARSHAPDTRSTNCDSRSSDQRCASMTAIAIALGAAVAGVVCYVLSERARAFVDEAWFLQVVLRTEAGESLYRDVFYGSGPLPVWMARLTVRTLGSECRALRKLAAVYYGATVGASVALIVAVGGGVAVSLATGVAVTASIAGRVVDNQYGVVSRLGALVAAVALVEWTTSTNLLWVVLGGIAAACAVLAKYNLGLVVVAVGALSLLTTSEAAAVVVFLLVSLAVVVAGLAALARQGIGNHFLQRAVFGKTTFVATGRLAFGSEFRLAFALVRGGHLDKAVSAASYVAMATSPAWVVLAIAAWRSTDTAAMGAWAVVLLTLVAIANAIPRADSLHVCSALPMLIVAAMTSTVVATNAYDAPIDAALALIITGAAVVLLLKATVRHHRAGPTFAPHGVPHFTGVAVPEEIAQHGVPWGDELRHLSANPVFVLRPDAAFWYLASGIANPTPFDYPLASTFGSKGQDQVADDLASGRITWCCFSPSAGLLTPRRLETFVPAEMEFVADTSGGTLYRSRGARIDGADPVS